MLVKLLKIGGVLLLLELLDLLFGEHDLGRVAVGLFDGGGLVGELVELG